MSKGIIYLTSTAITGLIKIGKTRSDQFENRMRQLESNGYANVAGLKREFAIEVEEYDDKERLLHDIFSKSRVGNAELFSIDLDLAKALLASFDGKQIFPINETKDHLFKKSAERSQSKRDISDLVSGEYHLEHDVKGFGKVTAKAVFKNGKFTLLKGSICAPTTNKTALNHRKNLNIKDNVLQEDVICKTLNQSCSITIGGNINAWKEWKLVD